MRADTKKRKNATQMLRATQEQEWWADQVVQVMLKGKRALDTAMLDIGRLVAETLMYMEREEKSGPDYHPTSSGLRKWASQRGSIYIGDQKLSVEHPRLRGPEGEVGLRTVRAAQESRGLLGGTPGGGATGDVCSQVRRDGDERRQGFWCDAELGVRAHLVEATAKQLKQFQERSLEDFSLFAMYLDTVHRGGQAFVVALGVDLEGKKLPLGFWEGATENHEICEELLEGLERRGLKLSKRVLWVTDGGGGIIKALKDRYGKEAHPPAVYAPQRSQHPAPPAQTLPQAGAPPLRDCLGAEQLQGREEDVAGVRAMASRHQRVGGRLTRRVTRGGTDAPQVEGPCSTAQEPALDESYREHVLHGSQLRAQHQTATVAARCASDGSLPCFCTASNSSNESRGTHPSTRSLLPSMRSRQQRPRRWMRAP